MARPNRPRRSRKPIPRAKNTVAPAAPASAYQLDNPERQTLDAYRRMGTGFVGAGLGASFALASWSALRIELPFSYFFPTTGLAISPTLAWVVKL